MASTPLSGIVLSLHGQLAVIRSTGNPTPSHRVTPVVTGGHHVAQGMLCNHQGPAFRSEGVSEKHQTL